MKLYHIKKNIPNLIFWNLVVVLLTNSCIEPFEIKTQSFENAIVVEALITNEYKTQQIKLSNSFSFEDEIVPPETDASVYISDDNGNRIDFTETSNKGTYGSEIPFAAESGNTYQLFITTSDNKSYQSEAISMTSISPIDNVYAERVTNRSNEDGVSIFVDSYDTNGNSKYYRYEYEETYKIVAPLWLYEDLISTSSIVPFTFNIVFKTTEQKTCYNTVSSNEIIITETTDLTEDRVEKFNLRFIKVNDPIITHRYSILVKQYVQSVDAYTYYKTLKKISSSDNGLVQNQPGFIEGNIRSLDNADEKVIGIFEVSSVSEQRIFFNYRDLFIDEALPPYFTSCQITAPSILVGRSGNPPVLYNLLLNNQIKYLAQNLEYPDADDPDIGPYLVVNAACGDCTVLGTNIKPDFWYE